MVADPHTAVKQELLVRYLDFWVPAALQSGRRATYLDRSSYGPAAAVRVLTEFADLLAGRELTMLVAGELPADPGIDGLRLATAPDDLAAAARAAGRAPVLAHVDAAVGVPAAGVPAVVAGPPASAGAGGPLAELGELGALAAVLGGARDGELLLATGATTGPVTGPVTGPAAGDPREPWQRAGFGHLVAVELVDEAGAGQLLRFATSATRSLERFKDELWAVDEYAGVRYRDPAEPEAVPLDISFEPHPGSLRRALLARLTAGEPQTVNQLRTYALTRTLYRPADVNRALSPLLSRGAVTREPERGRLTGETLIQLPG